MSRIYVATVTLDGNTSGDIDKAKTTRIRLVKADNPAQVRSFVTKDTIGVKYAEQQDIADLVALGVRVEDATDPKASQPTLDGV